MQVSELVTHLTQQGVHLWADRGKLKINAPKGVLTSQLRADIAAHKTEVLSFLRQPKGDATATGLNLETLGRLIGGGSRNALGFRAPVIESELMAKQLKVAFRPLPKGCEEHEVIQFRTDLKQQLTDHGITIVPWAAATRDFDVRQVFRKHTRRVVRSEINAVIDVERPVHRTKRLIAEWIYRGYSMFNGRFGSSQRRPSAAQIFQMTGWAEDHAMHQLEDPTATQVILITPLDEVFSVAPYSQKIALGVETLISGLSEIVIGVSQKRISILNMNLSDALFERSQLQKFISQSLIPKIYVPIAPLPLSQFEIGEYDPAQSEYACRLQQLSQALSKTTLFPSGFTLTQVIRRQSHRDIVDAIVNGRTGVSYGFVAYAEPPQYVGATEISIDQWEQLASVEGFDSGELRQNHFGRRYIKTIVKGQVWYRQIPDIWLVCSRSGADKTHLDLNRDILRLGLTGSLQLQLPTNRQEGDDIKPSYDTYVMVAIALAAALYTPNLIQAGAPMIHFHGYPERSWFNDREAYAGVDNPSVPCGTYESGIFNFLSIHELAERGQGSAELVGLVEPDHGINLVAQDVGYLLSRVHQGLRGNQIELGGKYFASLDQEAPQKASPQTLESARGTAS